MPNIANSICLKGKTNIAIIGEGRRRYLLLFLHGGVVGYQLQLPAFVFGKEYICSRLISHLLQLLGEPLFGAVYVIQHAGLYDAICDDRVLGVLLAFQDDDELSILLEDSSLHVADVVDPLAA